MNRLPVLLLAALPFLPACQGPSASPELMGTSEMTSLDYQGITPLSVRDGILLAGQPSEAAFEALSADGLRTVVDLRREEETPMDERALVEGLGMTYHQHEVGSTDDMTPEMFREVTDLLANSPRPLMLHCRSSNRVGAFWIVYRVQVDGVPIDQAVAEAKQAGLRSAPIEQAARDFLASQ